MTPEEEEFEEGEEESVPNQLFIIPIGRRPFFPGMAAPLVIEPGPHYEILKKVGNSEQKYLGLVLTKSETQDLTKVSGEDIYEVGVMARVLRVIPMEQGGAQVILNMEQRIRIKKIIPGKYLKADVETHKDSPIVTPELKAYSISIISTIKDLLKLNPLFKEELQIFLGHSDFAEPGK